MSKYFSLSNTASNGKILKKYMKGMGSVSGSILGKNFVISTWGESHGPALGVVIDGCPAGISISAEDIQKDLDRRKPGQSIYSTLERSRIR